MARRKSKVRSIMDSRYVTKKDVATPLPYRARTGQYDKNYSDPRATGAVEPSYPELLVMPVLTPFKGATVAGKVANIVVESAQPGLVPSFKKGFTNTVAKNQGNFPRSQKFSVQNYLDRRQHLKDLKKRGLVNSKVDVNKYARDLGQTEDLTQRAINHQNTFYRGVDPTIPTTKYSNNAVEDPIDNLPMIQAMKKAGVDMNSEESIGRYMASHIPLERVGYRAGLPYIAGIDGLYTSRGFSNYGDMTFRLKKHSDYSKGSYRDWMKNYDKGDPVIQDMSSTPGYWPSSDDLPTPLPRFTRFSDKNSSVFIGEKGRKMFDDVKRVGKNEYGRVKAAPLPYEKGGTVKRNGPRAEKKKRYLGLDRNRPHYTNAQGKHVSENKITVGTDSGEYVIPTVWEGKQYSDDDAYNRFVETGEHMGGPYNTTEDAERASKLRTFIYNNVPKYEKGGKVKPYITRDPNDPRIQAYRDSLDLYNSSQALLNEERRRIKTNINAYSPTGSISEAASSFNSLFRGESAKPQYSERERKFPPDWKLRRHPIRPVSIAYLGDMDFPTETQFANTFYFDAAEEAVRRGGGRDDFYNLYSPFAGDVNLYKKPVQEVILGEDAKSSINSQNTVKKPVKKSVPRKDISKMPMRGLRQTDMDMSLESSDYVDQVKGPWGTMSARDFKKRYGQKVYNSTQISKTPMTNKTKVLKYKRGGPVKVTKENTATPLPNNARFNPNAQDYRAMPRGVRAAEYGTGEADYFPLEALALPGTPAIRGLGKAANFAIDALNPISGAGKNITKARLNRLTPNNIEDEVKVSSYFLDRLTKKEPLPTKKQLIDNFKQGTRYQTGKAKRMQDSYNTNPDDFNELTSFERKVRLENMETSGGAEDILYEPYLESKGVFKGWMGKSLKNTPEGNMEELNKLIDEEGVRQIPPIVSYNKKGGIIENNMKQNSLVPINVELDEMLVDSRGNRVRGFPVEAGLSPHSKGKKKENPNNIVLAKEGDMVISKDMTGREPKKGKRFLYGYSSMGNGRDGKTAQTSIRGTLSRNTPEYIETNIQHAGFGGDVWGAARNVVGGKMKLSPIARIFAEDVMDEDGALYEDVNNVTAVAEPIVKTAATAVASAYGGPAGGAAVQGLYAMGDKITEARHGNTMTERQQGLNTFGNAASQLGGMAGGMSAPQFARAGGPVTRQRAVVSSYGDGGSVRRGDASKFTNLEGRSEMTALRNLRSKLRSDKFNYSPKWANRNPERNQGILFDNAHDASYGPYSLPLNELDYKLQGKYEEGGTVNPWTGQPFATGRTMGQYAKGGTITRQRAVVSSYRGGGPVKEANMLNVDNTSDWKAITPEQRDRMYFPPNFKDDAMNKFDRNADKLNEQMRSYSGDPHISRMYEYLYENPPTQPTREDRINKMYEPTIFAKGGKVGRYGVGSPVLGTNTSLFDDPYGNIGEGLPVGGINKGNIFASNSMEGSYPQRFAMEGGNQADTLNVRNSNRYFPGASPWLSAASVGLNALPNIVGLSQVGDPEVVPHRTINPSQVSMHEARSAAGLNRAYLSDMARKTTPGGSGLFNKLSNAGTSYQRSVNQITEQEQNTNAQLSQQANMFNAQMQHRTDDLNAQNRAANRTAKREYWDRILGAPAKGLAEMNQRRAEDATLNLQGEIYGVNYRDLLEKYRIDGKANRSDKVSADRRRANRRLRVFKNRQKKRAGLV